MGKRTVLRAMIGVAILTGIGMAGRTMGAIVPISPVVEDPVSQIKYQLLSNGNWPDSQAAAAALGGHLVVIRNAEQQNFVFSVFGGYGGSQRILWTGMYDPSQDAHGGTHQANLVWVDGEPVTYTNWDPGEPNGTGSEFYVAMYYPNYHNPGSWNDWVNRTTDPIGIPFYGVVEFVPEPRAIGILGAGIGAGLLLRRSRRMVGM